MPRRRPEPPTTTSATFALDPAVRSANGTQACPKGQLQARVRSMGDEQREDPYASARIAGETLRERTGGQLYDVALVMGSGWVPAADVLGTADHEIKTTELPGFPPAAVAGPAGARGSVPGAGPPPPVLLGGAHFV